MPPERTRNGNLTLNVGHRISGKGIGSLRQDGQQQKWKYGLVLRPNLGEVAMKD